MTLNLPASMLAEAENELVGAPAALLALAMPTGQLPSGKR